MQMTVKLIHTFLGKNANALGWSSCYQQRPDFWFMLSRFNKSSSHLAMPMFLSPAGGK
jgi:hypothetical protein